MQVTVEQIPELLRSSARQRTERVAENAADQGVSWAELGSAISGTAVIGVVAGIGSGDPRVATELVTTLPLTGLGACVLTTPALLALIPFFDMRMTAEDGVRAMAVAMVRAGRLAWGFVPLVLFAVATTELSGLAFVAVAGIMGVAVTRSLHRGLAGAEAAARLRAGDADSERLALSETLLILWCVLHACIGLRLLLSNLPF